MGFLYDIVWRLFGTHPNEGEASKDQGVGGKGSREPAVPRAQIQAVAEIVHPLEGHGLDEQQLACIACGARSQLVLAGAGTGKTTTIVGLVKYLLKSGAYAPHEILALSFTHASAHELDQRIKAETGQSLQAMTFHKLGLEIIKEATGAKPSISGVTPAEFAREELKRQMKNPAYARALAVHLYNARIRERKSQFDVKSEEDYEEYLKENPPITIRGEHVKSLGEVSIANFLYCNGIDYEYERPYEYNTATSEYGQYCPDFCLTESGVYIEFFAVGSDGKVPDYFEGKDGKSGTQTYLDGIAWKRSLHRDMGTDCIELFAYQEFDDTLQAVLKEQLQERHIDLRPIDPDEIWARLNKNKNEALECAAQLFGTLISLLKSTGITPEELIKRCMTKRSSFLPKLALPVYAAYRDMLAKNGQIDFDDMINLARARVEQGDYRHRYRFVIIDEYQDISASRQGLVQALRQQSDFRLFCVGDDWQSIYRFSGSDIGFILGFEKYWGESTISKIETTRRFPQSLIDVSGSFVMANPHQVRKQLKSPVSSNLFPVEDISGYTSRTAMDFVVGRLRELPHGSSVLLLGRYRFDVRMVSENEGCQVSWNAQRQVQEVRLTRREDLSIVFRTIHQSKGLEADYVFMLNNRSDGMGFPSRVVDDPVIEMLLSTADDYPFAEERRLFYVALTRARKKVFLVTLKDKESCFVKELYARWKPDMDRARYQCPRCGGKLQVKEGPYSRFLGCSNYYTTGCKFKREIVRKIESDVRPSPRAYGHAG